VKVKGEKGGRRENSGGRKEKREKEEDIMYKE
jgi:hypothetical protein